MRKKQEIEQFCASQEVIRNYIDYVKLQGGNPAHHQASNEKRYVFIFRC